MAGLDQQLHGYRQGHQLLSSTIRLPKVDQDLIDRLSDVAGPLSPGERFAPYLTLYPLPSESHYVVARTWQDFDTPRAGCVRTRSALVPMAEWQMVLDVASIIAAVTKAGANKPAERIEPLDHSALLPPVEPLQGTELIEALFLEERAPIVVFDVEMPETLALRLTTALWPGFRRTFSMSTFARSPRMIGRRSFDLVFASKEARSRFSHWTGRRIDGGKRAHPRHPWTASIVTQILSAPVPSLKSLDALGEMFLDNVGSESALRISLLWDDLRRKLPDSPTAALGMLDIVNTRKVRQVDLIRALEPALIRSAETATTSLQPDDAWRYLGALIQKLQGVPLSELMTKSIRIVAFDLASRFPVETLRMVSTLSIEPQKAMLLSTAADGISKSLDDNIAKILAQLDGKDLLDLMFASRSLAKVTVGNIPIFSSLLAAALQNSDDLARAKASASLMDLLVEDFQVEPVRLLINDLDAKGLIKEATHLHTVNGLRSAEIRSVLVERAQALQAVDLLRNAVSKMDTTVGTKSLVEATLRQTPTDIEWVLSTPTLKLGRRKELTQSLLASANSVQLRNMLADHDTLTRTLALLNSKYQSDAELLIRIACNVAIPSQKYLTLVVALLPKLNGSIGNELIGKAIEVAVTQESSDVSPSILDRLLSAAGDKLNGGRAIRAALQWEVPSAIASRNLVVFSAAPDTSRKAILVGVEEMAVALTGRGYIDITTEAAEAAATLLRESEVLNRSGFMRASAILLPFALNERREAASPIIGATFPLMYRELAKNSAFDLLSVMFVFLDWDKCKSARRQLVDAFLQSEWRLSDIAIAAVRAGDPVRILGTLAREHSGSKMLSSLAADTKQIPDDVRKPLREALKELGLS